MLVLLLIVAMTFAFPAYAGGTVSKSEEVCRILRPHTPKGADYVAGVDVYGKPVTPADVQGGANAIIDPVIIPITIDLAERYGLDLPTGAELKPEVAWLTIYKDGRIRYNEQDITKNVVTSCEEVPKPQEPPAKPAKSDGQKPADGLVSSDKIEGQYPEK